MTVFFEKLSYKSEENGFTIARYRSNDRSAPLKLRARSDDDGFYVFAATGYNLPTDNAAAYEVTGAWKDTKYGMQLDIDGFFPKLDWNKSGAIAFLESGKIKCVNKVLARRIVDRFGDDTFDIIETQPERLLEVNGVGDKRLAKIKETYAEHKSLRDISTFLMPYGITIKVCEKIRDKYGEQAVDIVKKDPFILCKDGSFGFKFVDDISRKMKGSHNAHLRIKYAVLYQLGLDNRSGHTYSKYGELLVDTLNLLNGNGYEECVEQETVEESIAKMKEDKDIHIDGVCVYNNLMYKSETSFASKVSDMLNVYYINSKDTIDEKIDKSEKKYGIKLSDEQRSAVHMCITNQFSVVTGGPGTGKTSTLKVILDVYEELRPSRSVTLVAPTGKAARRMSESTNREARTIHSRFEIGIRSNSDNDQDEQSDVKKEFEKVGGLIVVDEASMLDITVAAAMIDRVDKNAQIIFVGDDKQLPSVGAGDVLHDLIVSPHIPLTRLNAVYRQQGMSRIVTNANLMQKNVTKLDYGVDFELRRVSSDESAAKIVERAYIAEVNKNGIDNVQVLSPLRQRGAISTNALNKNIREEINPPTENDVKDAKFRVGDRVMNTVNNGNISNGDIGEVVAVNYDEEADKMYYTVRFFGEIDVVFGDKDADKLQLAYAITIHKSQGSEYNTVIIPVMMSQMIMLKRNLVYTGITRAKKKVILVGDEEAIKYAIMNDMVDTRNSGLRRRIGYCVARGDKGD